ncbi:MAG: hypothetical protein HGA87_07180, partial [Desulfobulbaceae bacterium]|nr:hypothetical protein [Desulfobulbaceae bacterium]
SEIVVGELDEDLRRHYTLMMKSSDDLEAIHTEMEEAVLRQLGERNLEELKSDEITAMVGPELTQKDIDAHLCHSILEQTFWNEVGRKFPEILTAANVGIRRGYKVVTFQTDLFSQLTAQLGGIFNASGMTLVGMSTGGSGFPSFLRTSRHHH